MLIHEIPDVAVLQLGRLLPGPDGTLRSGPANWQRPLAQGLDVHSRA